MEVPTEAESMLSRSPERPESEPELEESLREEDCRKEEEVEEAGTEIKKKTY